MKKIAIVMNEVTIGGVDIALIEMLRCFDYDRYEVTLWVRYGNGSLQDKIAPRVKVRYWGVKNTRELLIRQLTHGKILLAAKGIGYRILGRIFRDHPDQSTISVIRSLPLCTVDRYDSVICYQGISPVVIANALFRLRGERYILWIHGDLGRPGSEMAYMKKIYHRFDRAMAVSETAGKLFVEQYQYPLSRIRVFQNIVDSDSIRQKAEAPMGMLLRHSAVTTVGRLAPEKGQQMVPKTVRILLDQGYDIHWYLVGDGPLRTEVEQECEKYGVQDRVILLGTKTNPYPYIKNCDIYVQPSFTEGWGLTVQEARILAKPIVVTPLPVMAEQIISGENGLIVDAMTPEALADGIRQLLDHPELMEKFTNALKNESIDNSAELQKLYDFIES